MAVWRGFGRDREVAVAVWSSMRTFTTATSLFQRRERAPARRRGAVRCYCSSTVADLSEYLVRGCNWREAPTCPDYVGPVFIDRTSDGRGRGLFASRDVEAGEVLLISNAFAASYNDSHSIGLFTKLVTIVRQSPLALRQLYTLAGADAQAQDSMVVPSISLFDPGIDPPAVAASENLQFDEMRVMHIMNVNSFEGELSSPQKDPVTTLTGLWLLPSFINHSCSPNASRLVVREAMFIHAATDIQEKEEITIGYTDIMSPLRRREEALQAMGFGFRCECKRCIVERSVEPSFKEFSERFHLLYGNAVEEVYSAMSTRKQSSLDSFPACMELFEIFDSLRKKLNSFDSLTKLQKQWILAGYSSSFLGKWLVTGYTTDFAPLSDFVSSTAVELIEAMKATVPGMLRTLSFTTLLAIVAQRSDQNLILVHRLIQLAMEECICVYGKQKLQVTIRLMEESSEIVPFF